VKPEDWKEYQKKSANWYVRIGFELLHSQAFRELKNPSALKLLVWFHEKVRVKINKGRRGAKRYTVENGNISFTYQEGMYRGLTHQQFSMALKDLHRFGFIDIVRPGSARKGDWTEYVISQRWQSYGTANFCCPPCPRSVHWVNYGFTVEEKDARA